MKWVFVYLCSAFVCHGQPPKPGDGEFYESKRACLRAAAPFAILHGIKIGPWEVHCTQRSEPK